MKIIILFYSIGYNKKNISVVWKKKKKQNIKQRNKSYEIYIFLNFSNLYDSIKSKTKTSQ